MSTSSKWLSRPTFDHKHKHMNSIIVNRSSSSKFNSTKESDEFWLRRLDNKDWLAPNEVLKIFANLRHPELMPAAITKLSARPDYKPTEALYALLVEKLAHARRFDSIDRLLEKAKREKCRLSDDFFCRVIKIYGNVARNQERAMSTLLRMPDFHCWPDVKTFNYVLNMLVCNRQYEVVHEVFLSAPRLGVGVDTCCFNILIKGLCQWGRLDAAFSLLDEMPKQGCRPNATTYATLMHFLCKGGRVDEAFELLGRMEREGRYPDTVTFNVLISGLCKEGRVSEGMGLLRTMMLKGCYPNSGTYQVLLYGLLCSKRFTEAKEFMNTMVSEGRYPSFVSYKLAIDGLCDENLLEDVELVLKQMVRHGFVPRMGTWKKIITCMSLDKRLCYARLLNCSG
ncbi:pentatricopeptide repeat-containing protein-like, mitochondrial [Iris pallida]|uniref:Pentatricopeptide repeat-containing protein-like, mitochondrial n=1 Tax=Iris pallida TaxID=29817 RepID=A0AAX6HG31_IRIPA|nr:pentatricopeptide repeat-containing protein-like, mitochondrial [Iris pallida]